MLASTGLSVSMSRLSLLVDLASMLSKHCDLDALLGVACERVAAALEAERATLWLVDAERRDLFTKVALLPELDELRQPVDRGIAGFVARTGSTVRVDDAALDERFDKSADVATGYTTRTMLVAPIRLGPADPIHGVVQVLNRHTGIFTDADARYLDALSTQLARVLSLTTLKSLEPSLVGVKPVGEYNHVVGRSEVMARVYQRVRHAAETDAAVLLMGETGTGKGLLARAVHDNSTRAAGPFVVIDCTTLPSELVESELFGHERGAFTSADRMQRGKVEQADGGTLFIDEVGDLPLGAQAKLLRFVQERCFERVGGRETRRTDARLIFATHRDLEERVRLGTFREDLYYRIRVVPIVVPPLRERGDAEIAILVQHFAEHYAKRYGRPLPSLPEATLTALKAHRWPGNVRELEHWVESAVVLAPEDALDAQIFGSVLVSGPSPAELSTSAGWFSAPRDLTLAELERRYVKRVLEACEGNKTKAAEQLGVARNTLTRLLGKDKP